MHLRSLRTAVRPTVRQSFDRRRRSSDSVPGPRTDGYVSLRDSLGADLARLLAADPSVASVQVRPGTFTWRDGPDGRRQRYTPDLLAVMSDGSKVYRTVRPHALLLRDPDFAGRRARIELECLVRGGTFEVWTEREIREETCGSSFLRVATAAEAGLFAATPRHPAGAAGNTPPFVLIVADRLGLGQPRRVGDAFVARSLLTGILMAVLCDPVADPATGTEAWKPAPRRSGTLAVEATADRGRRAAAQRATSPGRSNPKLEPKSPLSKDTHMPPIEKLTEHPVAVDAFVLGDGTAVARPTVTVASCHATRTILGFALSLDPNPSTTVGEVATPDAGPDETHAPMVADRCSPLA